MNLALVHDWVVTLGGSEKCLQAFHEIWPEAPLYTLVYNQEALVNWVLIPGTSTPHSSSASLRRQNGIAAICRFYPLAIEQLDLSDHQVILSSSHAVAKGVLTRAEPVAHLLLSHTDPLRLGSLPPIFT